MVGVPPQHGQRVILMFVEDALGQAYQGGFGDGQYFSQHELKGKSR
jgi:hypothetical protein